MDNNNNNNNNSNDNNDNDKIKKKKKYFIYNAKNRSTEYKKNSWCKPICAAIKLFKNKKVVHSKKKRKTNIYNKKGT